ncbi:MAG: glycosyltransferase family 2 protein [Ignavibacteria bacterium]|nr:glycosyltransferase family 2 protein [Ignavibacteria bacterium]
MISVIIPNLNGQHHLKTCFDSLRAQTLNDFIIVLVDNNSSDDSVKFTEENYPEIRIIRNKVNNGFAKAVNQGIQYSLDEINPDYIILLNNDTECDKDFLKEMINGFKNKDTGSVACKMLNFTYRKLIDDAGDFIKMKGSPYARGFGDTDIGQYDNPEYIFGACAGASAYRSEVFSTAGNFDEDFFAYYEDVDFSFRLQLAGYKCFYNPKAIVYHKRGATTKSREGFQVMLCEKNLIAIRLKNYPLPMLLTGLPFFCIVRVKRYLLFLINESFSVFISALKGYIKGIAEIPASLRKRKSVQKTRVVSGEYLKSILR